MDPDVIREAARAAALAAYEQAVPQGYWASLQHTDLHRAFSTPGRFVAAVATMVAVYGIVFAIGVAWLPATARRQRSWLLTLVSSVGTSVVGIFYACQFVRLGLSGLLARDPALEEGGLSVLATLFFGVYLVLDLVVGTIYYREQVTFLSGWLHHTAYLVLVRYIFLNHLSTVFSAFLCCEIPTAIMSAGQLSPRFRSDLGFGISYLVTRVLFHAYLLYEFLALWAPAWPFALAAFVLHLHWFRQWIVSQRRKGILRLWEDRWRASLGAAPANAKAE